MFELGGGYSADSALVFLNLLEGNMQRLGQLLLRHALPSADCPDALTYLGVEGVGRSGLARAHVCFSPPLFALNLNEQQ